MTASRAIRLAIILVATLVAGCSSGQPGGPVAQPNQLVAPSAATPTPLATQPPDAASVAPKATSQASAKATGKLASFYKPPGWDGSSDVDCPDFDTHAHAQSFFKGTGGSPSKDPYRLDGNHDGVACENLP